MYPLLFDFPIKDAVWGGQNISKILNFEEPQVHAEALLLSACSEGETTVKNGEYKTLTLSEVAEKFKKSFMGENYDPDAAFPLTVSLIDAAERLPVGVSTADRVYYIAEAGRESEIIFGFSHDLSNDEIRRRINGNMLYSACNCIPVKKGDFIKIPAGTLHALGKDILAYAVFSGSEEFYTVSDYGRVDRNGKRAPLMTEKALSVMNLSASDCTSAFFEDAMLYPFGTVNETDTDFSVVSLLNINGTVGIFEPLSFCSLIITSGELTLSYPSGSMKLGPCDSVLLPADTKYKLTGFGTALVSHI